MSFSYSLGYPVVVYPGYEAASAVPDGSYTDINTGVWQTPYYNITTTSSTTNIATSPDFNITNTVSNDVYSLSVVMCQCFGPPSGETTGWVTPLTWYANPTSQYDSGGNWNTSALTAYPGPSFCADLPDASGTIFTNTFVFYLQPAQYTSNNVSADSFPVYSFLGVPSFANTVTTSVTTSTSPLDWLLFYQMTPGNLNSCTYTQGSSNGPITSFVGFPFYNSSLSQYEMMYFQILFALPGYSSSIFKNEIGGTNPGYLPGYLFAFYQRVNPACNGSSPVGFNGGTTTINQSPVDYPTYFPIIYDPNNLSNQSLGVYSQYQTLLGFGNYVTNVSTSQTQEGISFAFNASEVDTSGWATNLHDLFANLGWLEGITGSRGETGGINFGTVNTDGNTVDVSGGWYFAGYVPYNIAYTDPSTYWAPSGENVTNWQGTNVSFCSGNVVLNTMVNPSTTAPGNYFWQTLQPTTTIGAPSTTTFCVYVYSDNGYLDSNNFYWYPEKSSTLPSYVNVSLGSAGSGSNNYLRVYVYEGFFQAGYKTINVYIQFSKSTTCGINAIDVNIYNSAFSSSLEAVFVSGYLASDSITFPYYITGTTTVDNEFNVKSTTSIGISAQSNFLDAKGWSVYYCDGLTGDNFDYTLANPF